MVWRILEAQIVKAGINETAKKCVIVLSGGPDSATVAYWAKKQGYQIYPITFNYGQIAVKETRISPKNRRKTRHNHKNHRPLSPQRNL